MELVLIGVGLSMDAFAVALCKGLSMRRVNYCLLYTSALPSLKRYTYFVIGSLSPSRFLGEDESPAEPIPNAHPSSQLVQYTPVSYTHLDVYKRQGLFCGCAGGRVRDRP